jgi:RNA polymerase sigma-70 factor (ECF subfamily)
MGAGDSFTTLMDRLHAGDDAAAAEVFDRFAGRLAALAHSRLADRLRDKVDPEDVLQSVFRSFFTRYRAGQFRLENWESLWGLLTVIVLRKCGNQAAYFRAARRDVKREEPLALTPEARLGLAALAREPQPVEAAVLADTVEQLMRGLEERDRDVLALHLQGYTVAEIGAQVGVAQRTVKRALAHIREQLRSLEPAD